MICYNCGNKVPIRNRECDYCGEDLRVLQRAYRISNSYYNIGLSKTKVRDLTGAVFILKKSLEINKRNTDARDLLGLIYFEMGETVAAISEWVISKHLDQNSKRSESYLDRVQSNPNKLDVLSRSIKNYNAGLNLVRQGDDDLAIIQLKKVIRLNPSFIKALQLLGLLYIESGEYDKAYKVLNKARKTDVSNTTTLKYLKELEAYDSEIKAIALKQSKKEKLLEENKSQPFIEPSYKEDKPNVGMFVSLIAGIILGIIASVVLIIPTVQDEAVSQFRESEVEYNAEISKQAQEISSLEKENDELTDQVAKLKSDVAHAEETVEEISDNSAYENLIEAATLYIDGMVNNNLDYIPIADAISKIDPANLDNTNAINLYNKINDEVSIEASDALYDEGHSLYSRANYQEALETLLKSYEYNETNVNAIYFIGRSYDRLDNGEKAKEYYTILVEDYPATRRAREATSRLRELE